MNPLLQQVPTLAGVLLGALATYGATAAAERARWRRTQSVKWDDKRAAAYAEYSLALKQVIAVALRIATIRESGGASPDHGELAVLEALEEQRTIRWEAVLLLGSSHVVVAGRTWHQGVFRLERLAHGQPTDMTLPMAIDAISKGRRTFYEAAKRDLGVEIGDAPEAYEWQLSRIAGAARADLGDPVSEGAVAPLPTPAELGRGIPLDVPPEA